MEKSRRRMKRNPQGTKADSRFQVYEAVCKGASVEEVQELLKQGHSPDSSPAGCPPPFYRAVRFNKPDIALCLLHAHCRVSVPRSTASSQLAVICLAADLNMTEVVLSLCTNPECDVFARDFELRSIVHLAVLRKNSDLLQCLPSYVKNCDKFLTLRDGNGWTPLHVAASKFGNLPLLKLLLQMDKHCDSASMVGETVCRSVAKPSKQYSLSGLKPCEPQACDSENVKLQVKNGIKTEGKSSLICEGDVSFTDSLDDFLVTLEGKMRQELIDLPVMGTKKTLLHFAAEGRQVEVIDFLLGQGANVNAVDIMQNTPLHALFSETKADHRGLAAARSLLTAGADLTLRGIAEKSPAKDLLLVTVAELVVMRNQVAPLKLLKEFGQQFDTVNDYLGHTLLMLALRCGSEEVARYLLTSQPEHPALHTFTDKKGNTALHLVVNCRSKAGDLTELMLDQGYGAAMQLDPWPNGVCGCFPGVFDAMHKSSARDRSVERIAHPKQTYTSLTWAIRHRRLDIVQKLVKHDPTCLLRSHKHPDRSPLHVTLGCITDEMSVPFIDFLLAHGVDGNEVVCGETPCEYAWRLRVCQGGDSPFSTSYDSQFSMRYLKEKLGASFCAVDVEHRYCHRQDVGHALGGKKSELLPSPRRMCGLELRSMCRSVIRTQVRQSDGDFYAKVSSLPLPSSLIRYLLFIRTV